MLPAIRVPTLVLHRTDDRPLTVEEGRYVAAQIPGATLVELPGDDHLPFVGDQDAMLDEIERFLGDGARAPSRPTACWRRSSPCAIGAHGRGPSRPGEAFEAQARARDRVVPRPLAGGHADARPHGRLRRPGAGHPLRRDAGRGGRARPRAVRAGLHTGECELVAGEMRGVAVDLSSDLAALARPGEVLVAGRWSTSSPARASRSSARGPQPFGANGDRFEIFAVRTPAA